MNSALMFSKASDEWATPGDLFAALDAEFGFTVDVAARSENAKKALYLGPDSPNCHRRDALAVDWVQLSSEPTCWMNPPYSKCREFIAKAAHEAKRGCTVVALVPSRTDTRWFHEHVWDAEFSQPRRYVEVRFIRGRLKFGEGKNSAPFPSVVIIFRPVEP